MCISKKYLRKIVSNCTPNQTELHYLKQLLGEHAPEPP